MVKKLIQPFLTPVSGSKKLEKPPWFHLAILRKNPYNRSTYLNYEKLYKGGA